MSSAITSFTSKDYSADCIAAINSGNATSETLRVISSTFSDDLSGLATFAVDNIAKNKDLAEKYQKTASLLFKIASIAAGTFAISALVFTLALPIHFAVTGVLVAFGAAEALMLSASAYNVLKSSQSKNKAENYLGISNAAVMAKENYQNSKTAKESLKIVSFLRSAKSNIFNGVTCGMLMGTSLNFFRLYSPCNIIFGVSLFATSIARWLVDYKIATSASKIDL